MFSVRYTYPPRGSDHHVRSSTAVRWLARAGCDVILLPTQEPPKAQKVPWDLWRLPVGRTELTRPGRGNDVHADSRPFWTPDLSAFVIGFKRFLFNVLLFLGSLPEEYEPENVLRPAREKKGRFRPELRAARFLGKEAYRPARRPTGAEQNPPGANCRAIGEPAIGAAKPSGKGACSES